MKITTAVAEMIPETSQSAYLCPKRSLALASIQTRKPGISTDWKKCLHSSVGFDLPANPSKTAPIEEKEFRNMYCWAYACFYRDARGLLAVEILKAGNQVEG